MQTYMRAHVTTPATTYKGHALQVNIEAKIAEIVDRETGLVVLTMREAEWTSADGNVWRLTGTLVDGTETIWRASKACARCSTPMVYETPAWDVPV